MPNPPLMAQVICLLNKHSRYGCCFKEEGSISSHRVVFIHFMTHDDVTKLPKDCSSN